MWIMLNNAFVSIVRKDCKPGHLLVRARRREDLENLLGPKTDIKVGGGTDYAYRACVPEDRVAEIIAEQIKSINYSNFKDSIADRDLHDCCMNTWTAMARLGR